MSAHRLCCCGDPCSHCSGTTPAAITLVFSGVTLCTTGCIETYSGTHWSSISFDLNGTYDLTQDSVTPCVYQAVIGSVNIHDNSSCTGSPISDGTATNGGINLRVEFSSGTITVGCWFQKLSGGVGTLLYFFSASYSTGSPTFDCAANFTIPNDLVSGDCGSYSVPGSSIGYDGSVDISS